MLIGTSVYSFIHVINQLFVSRYLCLFVPACLAVCSSVTLPFFTQLFVSKAVALHVISVKNLNKCAKLVASLVSSWHLSVCTCVSLKGQRKLKLKTDDY